MVLYFSIWSSLYKQVGIVSLTQNAYKKCDGHHIFQIFYLWVFVEAMNYKRPGLIYRKYWMHHAIASFLSYKAENKTRPATALAFAVTRPRAPTMGPHVPGPDSVVAAPIGCLTLDKNGKIMKTNLVFAKMLDYNCSEIVGQPLAHFVTIEDRDTLHLHRMQVMESNAPYPCGLQLQAHNGRIIDAEIVSNVYLVDGSKAIQCYIRDVTKHKLAYEALEKSEKKFIRNWRN